MYECLLCWYHLLAPPPSLSALLTLLSAWPHWTVCTTWLSSFCPGSWSGWDNMGTGWVLSRRPETGRTVKLKRVFLWLASHRYAPTGCTPGLKSQVPQWPSPLAGLLADFRNSVFIHSFRSKCGKSGISLSILHCLPWFFCTPPTSL